MVLVIGLFTTQFIAADWYDTNWSYRTPVTITNSGSALTYYQVEVSLDGTFDWDNIESDGADIRFTESDGKNDIDFWIESWDYQTSAIIWVKVPSIAANPATTTIYLYYGNSSATSASDGVATFNFFDGFDSGTNVNPDKWTYVKSIPTQTSVTGGLLTMTAKFGGFSYSRIDGKTPFGTGYIGETRGRHPDQGTIGKIIESGFVQPIDPNYFYHCLRIMDDNPSLTNWIRRTQTGINIGPLTSMTEPADQDFHIFRLYRNTDNTVDFEIDNTGKENEDENIPTGNLAPFLMSYSSVSTNTTFIVDWTRVRKWDEYADPSAAVGTEQDIITWTGATDSDWDESGNWSPGPPTSTSFVLIPDVSNDPDIDGSNPVIQDLIIESSAILTIEPDATLTINGELENNGNLNLNSDASGISSLMFDSYSGSGNVYVHMYLTGGGGPNYAWHYIAVPGTMAKTAFTDVNPYNLLLWDESQIVDDDMQAWQWHDGYDDTNEFTTLYAKTGYNFYHSSASVTVDLDPVTSLLSDLGTYNLQWTEDGKNLIGNSLTCSIDWDEVGRSGSMRNAIYFTTNNGFASYVNQVGVPDGTTGIIPPLQGFFVKATASGASLDFTQEDVKVHGTVNRYKSNSIIPLLRLELQEDGQAKDETVIRFDYDATDTVDSQFDATKIFSESLNMVQIYTELNGEKYVINCINFPDESKSVPVSVKIIETGNYMIKRTQLQGLDNYALTLTDTYENITINLEDIEQYTFSSDPGTFTDRFIFTISTITTGVEDVTFDNKKFNIYTYSDNLNIAPLSPEWDNVKATINIYDLTGRRIQSHAGVIWYIGETKQLGFGEPKGIYIVEIVAGNNRVVQKISHR